MTTEKAGIGQTLRQLAEERYLKKSMQSPSPEKLSPEDTRQMMHELEVHQIELELQNEELRLSQESLDAARARYFDLYDLAPVGYCTIDESGLILEANLTAANMLGVTRCALENRLMSDFVLKEDQDIYYLYRKRLCGSDQPQSCELRMVKHDGTSFRAQMEATSVKAADDAKTRVILTDITRRKLAERKIQDYIAQQTVMMREMHHRVKNNMQMMSNLLELQSAYVTDEKALEFFRDSQQRIQSMAMVHEQLYLNEDLSRIDFTAYLHSLVDNLCKQFGGSCNNVNITIDAQPCILPVDTAIPCGLVVNELVSNAMKHAFPDGRAGEINIGLRVGGDGKIALEVADDGVGMPAEPGSTGFGMRLITLLVEKQLQGRLTITSNNPGTRVLCETGVQ